ncbi:hypothetical protein B0H16DRAFT_962902 [Mycena metata]|uniref:N-acetyltransferase domain-containing protein n=1 Tax=Mycena metata TaxID=1033252 RepID=A0AAD7IPV1_9AGAR|nr:hypothetical protein B0H16DRAFT_962902 [Mycena metata]
MLEAYVRDARPSDLEKISEFAARAFADDPEMNWFGGLSTAIMDDNPPLSVRKLENLRIFLDSVNRSVTLVGGRVTVVAIPQGSGQEEIVAFAAWVPPHKVIEGTMTAIRARTYRSLFSWGFSFRTTVVFKPTIGAIVKEVLQSKGYQSTDHYRLEITATDPDYQGKGYCRLLMKEGFSTCQSKPITLEATTAHSRDVYAHLGFEVVESLTLGKGQVNNRGLRIAKGEPATGFPVYVMIKWSSTDVTENAGD